MSNPSNFTELEKEILTEFEIRRNLFDNYLKNNKSKLYTCPGCAYPTVTNPGNFEICPVCKWEDDGQDSNLTSIFEPFFIENKIFGPNGNLSLVQNRINIGETLRHIAVLANGEIDLRPENVIKTLKFFDRKQRKIEKRMTGEETHNHPIWTEWRQVNFDLRNALIVKSQKKLD